MQKLLCHILLFFSAINLHAQEPKTNLQPAPISTAGKRRIFENILQLEKNIENAQTNMSAIAKNQKTIQQELEDLDKLEREHVELKKKYSAYLSSSEQEIKKNDATIHELEDWEKKSQNDSRRETASFKEKLETIQREKAERQRWKADATAKVERVGNLMVNLLKDLRDIQSRKGPLRSELNDWAAREKEYEKLVSEMASKKAQLEKMAKN